MNLEWEPSTQEQFNKLIDKVPAVMQKIARDAVLKKLQALVSQDNRLTITEKDLVDAFFEATPFGFHGPMKSDMETIGLDYTQYGYDK